MTALENCPICGYDKFKQYPLGDPWSHFYECERCGRFQASDQLFFFSDVKEQLSKVAYILSGLSRELHETGGKYPTFTIENYEALTKQFPVPDVSNIEEKLQKLLLRLRERTEYFGQVIELGEIELAVPLAYAKNAHELEALLKLMSEKKIAYVKIIEPATIVGEKNVTPKTRSARITLLEAGWDLSNSLGKQNQESDKGFIAVWFDESMNESIDAAEQPLVMRASAQFVFVMSIFLNELWIRHSAKSGRVDLLSLTLQALALACISKPDSRTD
ncbi:MAG: hypothetical protein Q8Q36_02840 [bacterium]|nr:hypothetical protein [bacterium]